MRYAKFVDGILCPAVEVFVPNEKFIYRPTEEQLIKAGFLPMKRTPPPEVEQGQKRVAKWVQTDNAIVQEWEVLEKEPTVYEIARSMIIQTADNNTALRMKAFYPEFKSIIGEKVKQGFKFTYGDKLYATVQPELTIQAHYPPGVGMESLYEEVCEEHDGTIDDAIPYSGNMKLESGKYYEQYGEVYLCNRDTGIAVHAPLSALVGQFVEEV